MIGHLRIKSPWSQLGLFLGLSGAGFVITSLALALILLGSGVPASAMSNLDMSQPSMLGVFKLVQAISSITIFLIPALAFALIVFRANPFSVLGLRPAVNNRMYLLAIICVLSAIPFVLWLGDLNQRLPLPHWMVALEEKAGKQMEQFLKARNTGDVVMNVFIIAFLPAVCEELFFRGALQRIIINISKNAWTGILVTGILFSALHFQFLGFFPRVLLGIILGALYWYSGSLWTSILAHFFNNAIQVVAVSYFPEFINKSPALPVLLVIFSCLIFLSVLWMYKSYSTVTYEKVYLPEEVNHVPEHIA